MKISLGINLNKPMELNHENELRITRVDKLFILWKINCYNFVWFLFIVPNVLMGCL